MSKSNNPPVPHLKTSGEQNCASSIAPFRHYALALTMCSFFSFPFSSCLAVYKATAYRGIPCVVLVIDGLVTYVGAPQEQFRLTLDEAIETITLHTAKEA